MIKDIKRIDLNGNEYLQESVVCDKCKNILGPKDFYNTVKLVGWQPVKMEPGHAYGLGAHQAWHLCEKCFAESSKFMNGEETQKIKSKTTHSDQLPGQTSLFDATE
jgi:hypothetical protein